MSLGDASQIRRTPALAVALHPDSTKSQLCPKVDCWAVPHVDDVNVELVSLIVAHVHGAVVGDLEHGQERACKSGSCLTNHEQG